MEAKESEDGTYTVGRFVLSKTNFEKAVQVIREAIPQQGWLVIDEIGPLELSGEGFCAVLKEVVALRQEKILLVVRDKEEMVKKVKEYFGINDAIVINSIEEIIPIRL
jgi:nucleoside-triphosphatase THEP1